MICIVNECLGSLKKSSTKVLAKMGFIWIYKKLIYVTFDGKVHSITYYMDEKYKEILRINLEWFAQRLNALNCKGDPLSESWSFWTPNAAYMQLVPVLVSDLYNDLCLKKWILLFISISLACYQQLTEHLLSLKGLSIWYLSPG